MLIKDLLEALISPKIERPPKLPTEYDVTALAQKRDRSSDPNAGWYSLGTPGKDPHEYNVSTWLPTNLRHDGKYHWIKMIKPYMGDNPYLPVYYNIRFERDKNGFIRTIYGMEKLTSLFRLSGEEKSTLAAKTFNNDSFYDDPDLTPNRIANILKDMANDLRKGTDLKIDDDLKQALNLINYLNAKHFKLDIHGKNIMARNTSRGYQLVITDPIQDEGLSIMGPK